MPNASVIRTKVSKAATVIKAIILATLAGWTGRRVEILECGPDFTHTVYNDDTDTIYAYDLTTGAFTHIARPAYGAPAIVLTPTASTAYVIHACYGGKDLGVEILVPAIEPRDRAMVVAMTLGGYAAAGVELLRGTGITVRRGQLIAAALLVEVQAAHAKSSGTARA